VGEKSNGQIYSTSGIPIKDIYTPEDVKSIDYEKDIGSPGKASVHQGRLRQHVPWPAMDHQAFDRLRQPGSHQRPLQGRIRPGQTGFSIAPDISTASGMDPDDPRSSTTSATPAFPSTPLRTWKRSSEICP